MVKSTAPCKYRSKNKELAFNTQAADGYNLKNPMSMTYFTCYTDENINVTLQDMGDTRRYFIRSVSSPNAFHDLQLIAYMLHFYSLCNVMYITFDSL